MVDIFVWGEKEIYILWSLIGLWTIILLVLVYKYPLSAQKTVYLAIFALVMTAMIALIIILLNMHILSVNYAYALWFLYAFLFAIIDLVEEVFLCLVFTKMVPSSVQSFAEGIRKMFTYAGGVCGVIISGSLFSAVVYVCFGLIVIFMLSAQTLFIRRHGFINANYENFYIN